MFDLALSILCSSCIFVIFKLYSTYKIQTFYAIITNYFIACFCGFLFYKGDVSFIELPQRNWFWGTFALGVFFIIVFNLMAATAQRVGVSVASVATKMSLVIPVLFGVVLYDEKLEPLNILGIVLALVAVYFASIKESKIRVQKTALFLPILVFLGSGIIDTTIKYMQEVFFNEAEFPLFSAVVFGAAALTGTGFILVKSIKGDLKINWLNVMGGIALGVPNYFSIFFLMRALQNDTWNSAAIFTINNVAIVMFSTLLGILLFKEKISPRNWGGIALAVVSILLVAKY
ncbi:MAG: DMT family transporter [Bacteroidota bacterium]